MLASALAIIAAAWPVPRTTVVSLSAFRRLNSDMSFSAQPDTSSAG